MEEKEMIRSARETDIPQIVEFNKAMAMETEGIFLSESKLKKGVEEIFKDPNKGFYLVYEIEGTVRAGLMITHEWSDWRNGNFWWIQSVFVEKEFRRRGLYKGLFNYLKQRMKEDPTIVGIKLYVDQNNKPAQKTYENLGMEQSNYLLFDFS